MKYNVSFLDSMKKCKSPPDNSSIWKDIVKSYNNYYLNYKGNKIPKIPKILHQIWLGSPFPRQYQLLIDHWRKQNPLWEFKLWTEDSVEKFGLVNQTLYNKTKNYSAKSDIVRFEVLNKFGGIYTDTDYYFKQPFDDLMYLDFFTGCMGGYKDVFTPLQLLNSIFGSIPGHKFLNHMIQVLTLFDNASTTVKEIMERGPTLFENEIIKFIGEQNFVIFPVSFFGPFPTTVRYLIRNLSVENTEKIILPYAYEETYAIHLWYCSWQKGL